jgi:hypothetical protein
MKWILFGLSLFILIACSSSKDDVITTPDYTYNSNYPSTSYDSTYSTSDTPNSNFSVGASYSVGSSYDNSSYNTGSSYGSSSYNTGSSYDSSSYNNSSSSNSSSYSSSSSSEPEKPKGFFSSIISGVKNATSSLYDNILGSKLDDKEKKMQETQDESDAKENTFSSPARNQYDSLYQETCKKTDEFSKEFKANVDAEVAAQDLKKDPDSDYYKKVLFRRMRRLMKIRERNQSKGYPVGLPIPFTQDMDVLIQALRDNYDHITKELEELKKEKNKYLKLSYQ